LARQLLGMVASEGGKIEQAIQFYEEALPLAQQCGNRWIEDRALLNLGNCYLWQHNYIRARRHYLQSKVVCEAIGDVAGAHFSDGGLAWIAYAEGNYAEAVRLCEMGNDFVRQEGGKSNIAAALADLADMVMMQGDYMRAAELLEESLAG